MGRAGRLWTCAALALTVGAFSAAGAQGAEYGRCQKAHGGLYANSGCTELGAGGHGSYEWTAVGSGGLPSVGFVTPTEAVHFKTAISDVSCLGHKVFGNSLHGTITSPGGGVAELLLKECAGDGSPAESGIAWHHFCGTAGAKGKNSFWEMEIPLRSQLVEGVGGVEAEYSGEGPQLTEINCGKLKFKVTGTFSGPITEPLDEMSKTGESLISNEVGTQDLQVEYTQDGGASWEGPIPMSIDFECGVHQCFPMVSHYKPGLEIRR